MGIFDKVRGLKKSHDMAAAAAKTTGNSSAIKDSNSKGKSHKTKNDDIVPFGGFTKLYMLGSAFANYCDEKGLVDAREEEQTYHRDRAVQHAMSNGDNVTNAYDAVMNRFREEDIKKKIEKRMKSIEKRRKKAQVFARAAGSMGQMSNVTARKGAYSQLIGNRGGVNREEIAVASNVLGDDHYGFV